MRRVVVVVLDGLRRDFAIGGFMPRLAAFMEKAETYNQYKSVAPSVTRVCSSTFTTGCYPAQHGVEGNSFALYDETAFRVYDTGKPDFFEQKRRITASTLERPGLAERLRSNGGSMVFSNVSPGAAYAHDPDGNGYVYHRAGSFGPGRQPLPATEALVVDDSIEGDRQMTERFIKEALGRKRPAFALLWLGHPDSTQHYVPLGSPEHLLALTECDRHVALIIDRVDKLRRAGDDVLLIIASDHGHETVTDVIDVQQRIAELGFATWLYEGDIVIVPNGTSVLIYATTKGRDIVQSLASTLQGQSWVGSVIEPNDLQSIGHAPTRGLALFVSMAASEEANEYGVPGCSLAAKPLFDKLDRLGCGQHGGLGRFEQSPILAVDGTGFEQGGVNARDVSLVDLAPTILKHLHLPSSGMDGAALQNLP